MREFDVVIIGGGPAGELAAARAAEAGLEVALVERDLVGGECAFWACMPSKALLRPAEALAATERVPGAREAVDGGVDMRSALARRDEVIHGFDDSGQAERLERRGVALFRGHGKLAGERCVRADGELLRARRAVIVATGSDAALPDLPGLRDARPWTSREGTTAEAPPERLVVLGGGVVGVELAQAWETLGSRVWLLEQGPALLAGEEPFAGEQVERALRERGVDVRTCTQLEAVERPHGREVTLRLRGGGELTGDELLVAAGRTPRTNDLGLEALGLRAGAPLRVDNRVRVEGHPWLYAVGDVNGLTELTHMGKYQAGIAIDQILGRDVRLRGDDRTAPRVVFTEPQVAAVGHTLERAGEAGFDAFAVDRPTSAIAGASFFAPSAEGTARLVIDRRREVVIGATFTGPEVAELLHAATIAVACEIPLDRLRHAVPAFPTRSELWLRLLESAGV